MLNKLTRIADELSSGRETRPVTVREFLRWFDAQRRGYWIVREIREQLQVAGLKTVPDFESAYIDAPITFELAARSSGTAVDSTSESGEISRVLDATEMIAEGIETAPTWVRKDPTYRISKLAAANQGITSIKPDGRLAEAVTVMMSRDFSQLPVMSNEREVKGVISWKSIGSRLALSRLGSYAREFMDPHHEIRAYFSIFDAIPLILKNDYVLVRGEDNRITGVITATDLSRQFLVLAEPFLLLGEVENLVRSMIADRFSLSELAEARDPGTNDRQIQTVADLTFGEYIRLLENPSRWPQLNINIDRVTFCKDLDRIRKIRNDVMHFDPDGVPTSELDNLRSFTEFLKQLQAISDNS